MLKLGLIGKDISHSKSQEIYESLLERPLAYQLFDSPSVTDIPNLEKLFNTEGFDGLSVTAPYKRVISEKVSHSLPFNIVNCLKWEKDKVIGTNTDFLALQKLLPEILEKANLDSVVLLGNGAMAEVTTQLCVQLGIKISQYFRSKDGPLEMLDLSDHENILIINSCSRGFLFSGSTPSKAVFWNYNYSDFEQKKLIETIQYVDGLELLRQQAIAALSFWGLKYL